MVVAGTTSGEIICFEPGLYHQQDGLAEEVDDKDDWSSDEEDALYNDPRATAATDRSARRLRRAGRDSGDDDEDGAFNDTLF